MLITSLLREQTFPTTDGAQVRDYLHVEDAAAAFLALALSRASGTVNISSGVPVSIRAVVETVEEVTGRSGLVRLGEVPYRAWEPMFVCGDNRRLRDLTAWAPRYSSLRSGLVQTVDWWRSVLGT